MQKEDELEDEIYIFWSVVIKILATGWTRTLTPIVRTRCLRYHTIGGLITRNSDILAAITYQPALTRDARGAGFVKGGTHSCAGNGEEGVDMNASTWVSLPLYPRVSP